MGTETYLHRYAKQTLASWLKRKRSGKLNWILQDVILSETNNNKTYGIQIEYPIVKIDGGFKGHTIPWDDKIPTYYQLKQQNIIPKFIFDIAVINDLGNIEQVFEIKYKNAMSANKIKFLNNQGIKYYELSALEILEHCRPPKFLEKK